MSLSQRRNDACQMCQSTDGELISLLPGNIEAARLTKKIRSISSILVENVDIKQMCRRCIYLAESVSFMKRYLTLAETMTNEIWKKPCKEEVIEAENPILPNKDVVEPEISAHQNEDVVKAEVPAHLNEDVINAEIPAHVNEDVIQAEIPAHPNKDTIQAKIPAHANEDAIEAEIPAHPNEDVIEAEIPVHPNKDVIQAEIPAYPNKEMEHAELSYDIEWISEEERIKVINAFSRKWENERKKKLEEASKIMHQVERVEETLSLDNVENQIINIESPDKSIANDSKPEEHEDNIETEASMTKSFNAVVKTEYIETEELDNTIQSDKTDEEPASEVTEEKEDSNVIVISDSDEHDSSDLRRQPLSTIPSDSSGVIGNSNASWNSQRGRKIICRAKFSASEKNASGVERKETTALKTTNGQKMNSKVPRKFFQCTRCNVNLYTVAAVLLHHNQVHTPNKASLSCRMCDKTFPAKSDLFAHFNQHVESHLFRCPYCRSEFVLKANLMIHIKTHKKRAWLSEPKSLIKRFRNNSQDSVEDHSQSSQCGVNNENSLMLSTDALGNSEKENIMTADMQILDAQDLDNKVLGRKDRPREDAANVQTSVVQTADTNLMEQEEEDRGNENGTTGN